MYLDCVLLEMGLRIENLTLAENPGKERRNWVLCWGTTVLPRIRGEGKNHPVEL
jgi:hypothetical protein